jgi:hypothetical protein
MDENRFYCSKEIIQMRYGCHPPDYYYPYRGFMQ